MTKLALLAFALLVSTGCSDPQDPADSLALGQWFLEYSPSFCTGSTIDEGMTVFVNASGDLVIDDATCTGTADATGENEITVTCHSIAAPEADDVWVLHEDGWKSDNTGISPTASVDFTRSDNGCKDHVDAYVGAHWR
jgi:hypothetical protein